MLFRICYCWTAWIQVKKVGWGTISRGKKAIERSRSSNNWRERRKDGSPSPLGLPSGGRLWSEVRPLFQQHPEAGLASGFFPPEGKLISLSPIRFFFSASFVPPPPPLFFCFFSSPPPIKRRAREGANLLTSVFFPSSPSLLLPSPPSSLLLIKLSRRTVWRRMTTTGIITPPRPP